jgi:glycosyltransferase involved in cell wall biosynthesis
MRFSIIIPTYNEEKDIDVLLNSILQQSLESYEVIFVDGSSKDNTLNKLEIFKKKCRNVKIYSDERFDRNRARNFGIKVSKGDIILLLNADVRLSKNFLYHLKQYYLFNKNADAVLINSKPIMDENSRIAKYFLHRHIRNYSKDIYQSVDWTEGFSCKKKNAYFPVVKSVDLKGGEDSLYLKKFKSKNYFLALSIEHRTPITYKEFIDEKISRGRGNIHAHIFFLNMNLILLIIKVVIKLLLHISLLKYCKVFFNKEFYKFLDLYYIEGICISIGEFLEISKYKKLKKKILLFKS